MKGMGHWAANMLLFFTFIYDLSIWHGTSTQLDVRLPHSLWFVASAVDAIVAAAAATEELIFFARVLFFIAHSLFHSTMHDTMMILIRTHIHSRPKNNAFLLLVSRASFVLATKKKPKTKQPIYIHAYAGVNSTIIIQCGCTSIIVMMPRDAGTWMHLLLNANARPM